MEKKLTARQKQLLKQQEDNNTLNLVDIFGLCMSNWYWFALCLAVTMIAAALYLRVTSPVFTRSTSIIVKEDASAVNSTMFSANTAERAHRLPCPSTMR